MKWCSSLPILLLVFGGFLPANGVVVQLDSSNFDQYVNGDRYAFVEFYAPWCGHCKRLAPAYEEVGAAFDSDDSVVIAKVDADGDRTLGGRFGVQGFPTLKFFPKGSTEPEDYNGGRTAEDIIQFINGKANTRAGQKKPPSAVLDVDQGNFDGLVLDTSKNVLVEFYAPWCGHCKALAPVYEEVAASFVGDEDCVVAKVDADANREVGSRYGVTGFPTIKFFPKDNKDGESYEGGRRTEDFVQFLNEKCGTSRLVGGKLSQQAGIVESMNGYAEQFMNEAVQREDIVAKAATAAESEDDGRGSSTAGYYVKVMKKVLEKGAEYIKNESERLGRILNGDISLKKSDELTKKRNVLKKFEL